MIIREFKTARFLVRVTALPDDDVDLSFDDSGEVARDIEAGRLEVFTVRAVVLCNGVEMADDYLGGCIYETPRAFMDHSGIKTYTPPGGKAGQCGSYFADMVRNVCRDARKELKRLQAVRVRG